MIKETHDRPEDTDYSQEFRYETEGACTVRRIWVDETLMGHGFWLESNDGQRVLIPEDLRKLLAKRCRELTFR
jgi:hypothetical protein